MNAVMSEEDLRMARVLGRDEIYLSKYPQGSQGNVFEITNGSGNDVESARHRQIEIEIETEIRQR
jgi:hypothetical protein